MSGAVFTISDPILSIHNSLGEPRVRVSVKINLPSVSLCLLLSLEIVDKDLSVLLCGGGGDGGVE